MKHPIKLTVVFGLLLALISACGGSQTPKAPSAARPAPMKPPAAPAAATTPAATTPGGTAPVGTEPAGTEPTATTEATPTPAQPVVAYDPGGRRDPFRSILVTSESAKSLKSLPPLLRTDVGELQLIAIVWGGFGYSAMVRTPDGKGYTIRVGTLVGPNKGVVRRITKTDLTIEEKYTDIFGEKKIREVKMDLHPQKEGSE